MVTRYGLGNPRYESTVAYSLADGFVGRPWNRGEMNGDDTKRGRDGAGDPTGDPGEGFGLTASADSDDTGGGDGDDAGTDESRTILEGAEGDTAVPPTIVVRRGAGVGARLAGVLAAALGLLGCLLSFALLAISIRSGFSANGVAETTAEPLAAAVDRLETRIDQTDDLIDRDGVSGSEFSELQARLDGLADTATSASQAFSAIDDHVLYRWLPIDKTELSSSLADFREGADESVGIALPADSLTPAQATRVGDRINAMQTSVSGTGELVESTVDSLTNWIRLSALGGFFLSLWLLWAQISLMKRGWRGIRGDSS